MKSWEPKMSGPENMMMCHRRVQKSLLVIALVRALSRVNRVKISFAFPFLTALQHTRILSPSLSPPHWFSRLDRLCRLLLTPPHWFSRLRS
ncbi:hypothetical protein OROGR_001696 [Orobanche gracilis]